MTLDHNAIRDMIRAMGLFGDPDTGLMHRFGVFFNMSPVSYLISREIGLINKMGPAALKLSEQVLIDAAQYCTVSTFGGMMGSDEWERLIAPEVHNMQDRFDGLVLLTNCLGWGKVTSYQLDEQAQTLTFTVGNSYYLKHWLNKCGKPDHPICYMWRGVAGGYMDLLFGNNKVHTFVGSELKCAAMGDSDQCEFYAERMKKKFNL
jgi:hypothetical protein